MERFAAGVSAAVAVCLLAGCNGPGKGSAEMTKKIPASETATEAPAAAVSAQEPAPAAAQPATPAAVKEDTITTKSGLKYIVRAPGTGGKPSKGAMVKAHYTGKFLDGRVFDSSVQRGTPFSFSVGLGQVIAGWDEAFLDMTKGEKRTLIIPPGLAYGENGAGGVIPPSATLVFDVELICF